MVFFFFLVDGAGTGSAEIFGSPSMGVPWRTTNLPRLHRLVRTKKTGCETAGERICRLPGGSGLGLVLTVEGSGRRSEAGLELFAVAVGVKISRAPTEYCSKIPYSTKPFEAMLELGRMRARVC